MCCVGGHIEFHPDSAPLCSLSLMDSQAPETQSSQDTSTLGEVTPERLSARVGEALWRNGWLVDRAELFDRCLVGLRRSSLDRAVTDREIDEAIYTIGETMVWDALLGAPSAVEAGSFAEHLVGLFGLTEEEAAGAEQRFHQLDLADRQALLSLLWAPDGHAGGADEGAPEGFKGLLDDESGTLLVGAERALLALFDQDSLQAKEANHG